MSQNQMLEARQRFFKIARNHLLSNDERSEDSANAEIKNHYSQSEEDAELIER